MCHKGLKLRNEKINRHVEVCTVLRSQSRLQMLTVGGWGRRGRVYSKKCKRTFLIGIIWFCMLWDSLFLILGVCFKAILRSLTTFLFIRWRNWICFIPINFYCFNKCIFQTRYTFCSVIFSKQYCKRKYLRNIGQSHLDKLMNLKR